MGIQGRALEKDHTLQEIGELIIKHFGVLKNVAQELGCSQRTLYDYIDIYPELKAIRIKASSRKEIVKVESANEVLEILMNKVNEDPSNAFRSAQYILNKSKESQYFTEENKQEGVTIESLYEALSNINEVQSTLASEKSRVEN